MIISPLHEKLVRFRRDSKKMITCKEICGTTFQEVANEKTGMIQVVDFVETSLQNFV